MEMNIYSLIQEFPIVGFMEIEEEVFAVLLVDDCTILTGPLKSGFCLVTFQVFHYVI